MHAQLLNDLMFTIMANILTNERQVLHSKVQDSLPNAICVVDTSFIYLPIIYLPTYCITYLPNYHIADNRSKAMATMTI